MQVHYNLLNGRAPDRSRALLTVAPAAARLSRSRRCSCPRPVELRCAAGRAGKALRPERGAVRPHAEVRFEAAFVPAGLLILCRGSAANPRAGATSTCDRRLSQPTTIHVAAGHMHLLGASIRSSSTRERPARACCSTSRAGTSTGRTRTRSRGRCRRSWRRRSGHLPPRRAQAHARRARGPEDAALHPVGRGDDGRDVPGDPPGDARLTTAGVRCGSFSSRRCIRARTTLTSGSSSPTSSESSPRADTSSSAQSSTGARAAKRRHFGLALDARRTARSSAPMSSTRTSSCRPGSSPRSRRALRSS